MKLADSILYEDGSVQFPIMNQYAYKTQQLNMPNGQPQQLTPISNLSTQPYQPDTPGPPQILPPLYSHNGPPSYHAGANRSYPNGQPASHTPQPPSTPSSNAQTSSGGQAAQNGSLPSLVNQQSQSSYTPIVPAYHTMSQPLPSIGGHSAAGQPNGQPASTLPNISPGMYSADGRHMQQSPYQGQPQLMSQPHLANADNRYNMPVVGTQGRRGILPSAPGRGPMPGSTMETSTRTPPAPVKNAEGKYPCQFCNKTYLHAKHLKRHNLRHTGERPYQCSLCSETFCRSDILKRHFQKCAARRGNPSGATHLTHAQAHLRPQQQSSNAPSANGYPNSQPARSSNDPKTWLQQPGLANNSDRSSRASSIIRPGSSGSEEKKRYEAGVPTSVGADTNPGAPTHAPAQMDRNYGNYGIPDRLHSQSYPESQPAYSAAVPPSSYPMSTQGEQPQQGMMYNQGNFNHYQGPPPGHVNGDGWGAYFQPGAQDAMMFSQ